MKKIAILSYLLLLTNLVPEILKAQKNEISVLPARIYFDSFNGDLEFAYAFQYAEFEHKLNNKFSVNFGAAFKSKRKESNNNLYKNQYLLFNSGIKYYMNKKNNMSGFYSGIGVLLEKYKERSTGNFDDFISTSKEFNGTQNYFGSEISSGYKYCFIKNRVSVDLSLRTRVLMYRNNIRETIYLDNSKNTFNNLSNNWGITVLFMDLRIGYRFGFKK
jgi:hypothetical protein